MEDLTEKKSLLPIHGTAWKGVRYGCTTRGGGVSSGPWKSLNLALHVGDDADAVHENRRRLAACLPGEPFWLEQVHGTDVIEVKDTSYIRLVRQAASASGVSDSPQGEQPWEAADLLRPRADAAITTCPGVVLAIMTADCIPVVMADSEGRALAVAHAGWRGLAAGVLEATLAALRLRLPQATWRAWVGPCIGQASFEVGDEVREAFIGQDAAAAAWFAAGRKPGKWQADLAGLARHRLEMMGVYGVELSGLCTFERDDLFHSYRRSTVSGRMATVAWLQTERKS